VAARDDARHGRHAPELTIRFADRRYIVPAIGRIPLAKLALGDARMTSGLERRGP
jgi:hypothetical protein